jgi:catechol 2,3-dioxygenase-like lactoylglutathione lyase family enzyme
MTRHPPLPSREEIAELPLFEGLSLESIHLVADDAAAEIALTLLLREHVLGFDTESKPTFLRDEVSQGPHLVQFATDDAGWLFQLRTPGCRDAVCQLMAQRSVRKVGFGLENDRVQMAQNLGGEVHSLLDLDAVFRHQGYRKSVGVKTVIALLYGQRFAKSKRVGTSNWANPHFTEAQLRYAANDAYAALCVYRRLLQTDETAVEHATSPIAPEPRTTQRDVEQDPQPSDGHLVRDAEPIHKKRSSATLAIAQTIPLMRIFDVEQALAFYRDFLGFAVDWQHRAYDQAPQYLQISRAGCVLHLTEHQGDCTPGSTVFVRCTGLRAFHAEITAKNYGFMRPGIEPAPWGGELMEVIDPFGNRLRFAETD